jgi:hypothetical protein
MYLRFHKKENYKQKSACPVIDSWHNTLLWGEGTVYSSRRDMKYAGQCVAYVAQSHHPIVYK